MDNRDKRPEDEGKKEKEYFDPFSRGNGNGEQGQTDDSTRGWGYDNGSGQSGGGWQSNGGGGQSSNGGGYGSFGRDGEGSSGWQSGGGQSNGGNGGNNGGFYGADYFAGTGGGYQPYGSAPRQPRPATPGNGLAIASLVCGVASLLCCCALFLSTVLGIVAVVLAILSCKKNAGTMGGMAIAGLICGVLGALFGIFTFTVFLTNRSVFQEVLDEIEREINTNTPSNGNDYDLARAIRGFLRK